VTQFEPPPPTEVDSLAEHEQLVQALCDAVDDGDAETFGSYFAEDAVYQFGNNEPIIGRAAITEATAGTAGGAWPFHHEVNQVAAIGTQLFCRFTIHVSHPSDGELALPCVTVIELRGDDIVDYRVHMDIRPALKHAH
jgi:uncharacterized protein (TIGR02246 family)